jgi:sugar O-acyltransferase (sialic acid O-acetyltransferase NeuD family)
MMNEKLLLVGAGGQGKVVIDAVRNANMAFDIILADDDERKDGQKLLGHEVTAPVSAVLAHASAFHVAIGNNAVRARVTEYLADRGLTNRTLVHHNAYVAESASIGLGAFVAAHAVVGPDATVAVGCIVNHGAVVDHDCQIDDFSHIAPGATLGGGVRIGKRVLIGAGANILPGVSIGDDCVVGAGAVVLNNLEPGGMHAGVPAHRYK